ncbi:MAG TPA: type I restriction enzyme endonuclease domain-containing protein, partial [Pyrinomonadaceae bacterium]|nr:type I restriction enzyme endonuclease domain-containing protein [Pyrinomonadaceae bacterium]
RMDYLEHFQEMIDDYNSGAINVEVMFERLVTFTKELNEEEQRHISEKLSVEELAIFDLLTKPKISLIEKERNQVKKVARELLKRLKHEKLVLDWRSRQQSKAAVRLTIEETLDLLPRVYSTDLYSTKCDVIYQDVFDSYFGAGRSVLRGCGIIRNRFPCNENGAPELKLRSVGHRLGWRSSDY